VTPAEALAFVCTHGLVLESGTGPVPSLAAAIAGEPIRGSWWAQKSAFRQLGPWCTKDDPNRKGTRRNRRSP
jgi:hypothetical protein